jgi:hypothetical protein
VFFPGTSNEIEIHYLGPVYGLKSNERHVRLMVAAPESVRVLRVKLADQEKASRASGGDGGRAIPPKG